MWENVKGFVRGSGVILVSKLTNNYNTIIQKSKNMVHAEISPYVKLSKKDLAFFCRKML